MIRRDIYYEDTGRCLAVPRCPAVMKACPHSRDMPPWRRPPIGDKTQERCYNITLHACGFF
jgi:hypothetical protein